MKRVYDRADVASVVLAGIAGAVEAMNAGAADSEIVLRGVTAAKMRLLDVDAAQDAAEMEKIRCAT